MAGAAYSTDDSYSTGPLGSAPPDGSCGPLGMEPADYEPGPLGSEPEEPGEVTPAGAMEPPGGD